jgi:hypothetical protein
MNMLRRTGHLLLILALGTAGLETGLNLVSLGKLDIVGAAEARVSRATNTVRVGGVGTRTVRRCAADVYDC